MVSKGGGWWWASTWLVVDEGTMPEESAAGSRGERRKVAVGNEWMGVDGREEAGIAAGPASDPCMLAGSILEV